MPLVGDNEWLQSAAGGQKTTEGAAPDFVILIALCGLNCFIVPNKQAKNDKLKVQGVPAFHDFWVQRVIMKCGDHEFRGLFIV